MMRHLTACAIDMTVQPAAQVHLATIAIPAHLEVRLHDLTLRTAERLGCSTEDARRLVEVSVVTRGLDLLEREAKA